MRLKRGLCAGVLLSGDESASLASTASALALRLGSGVLDSSASCKANASHTPEELITEGSTICDRGIFRVVTDSYLEPLAYHVADHTI